VCQLLERVGLSVFVDQIRCVAVRVAVSVAVCVAALVAVCHLLETTTWVRFSVFVDQIRCVAVRVAVSDAACVAACVAVFVSCSNGSDLAFLLIKGSVL